MNILVGYASRHGSTRGIAERIAETIRRAGHDVTLQEVDGSTSGDGFDAYVIGSAAYNNHWLPAASSFLRRNAPILATRPIWLFSSGPVGTDRYDKQGRDQLVTSRPREFDEFEAVHPRASEVFFGAWDPAAPAAGMLERLSAPFLRRMTDVLPTGDFRDWRAIEAWAQSIADDLAVEGAGRVASTPSGLTGAAT